MVYVLDCIMEDRGACVTCYQKCVNRLISIFTRRKFNSDVFRSLLLGGIIGLVMNEAVVQLVLKMSVDAGELPGFVNDALFIGISAMETILAPFVCWLGQSRRVFTMSMWILLAVATTVPLFFLTIDHSTSADSVLCNPGIIPRSSGLTKPVLRLVFLSIMGLAASFARLSVWAHGITCLDYYKPQYTVRIFGVTIAARMMLLVLAKDLISDILSRNMTLQIVGLIAPLLIKVAVLSMVPRVLPVNEDDPEIDKDLDTGFLQSIGRVTSNRTALTHMIAAGFFTAGLWGFTLYSSDLVKAKYFMVRGESTAANMADGLRLIAVVLAVLVIGNQFIAPSAQEFDILGAIKKTIFMSVMAMIAVIVMMLLRCERSLAGLGATGYVQPLCSSTCNCSPSGSQFSPVCLLNTMTTYFSPCHAGCRSSQLINGTTVVSQCACEGAALVGACDPGACHHLHSLHQMMIVVLLSAASVALVLHAMVVLRTVSWKDKSVALGITFSVVALLAFVGGHAMFLGLDVRTCAWRVNYMCRIHNSKFALTLGVASCLLISISLCISIVSFFLTRRKIR